MKTAITDTVLIRWLSEYGCLPVQLIKRMVGTKYLSTFYSVQNMLIKERVVQLTPDKAFLRINNKFAVDPRVVDALWVLSQFEDTIEVLDHGLLQYPAQVFFLKRNSDTSVIEYEIVVLKNNEENFLNLLTVDRSSKYIFVIPDRSLIDKVKRIAKKKHISTDQYFFACLYRDGSSLTPDIEFYKVDDDDEPS